MSRVSDALMRAAEQATGAEKLPDRAPEGEAGSPFVSAWDLDLAVQPDRASVAPSGGLTPDPGGLTPHAEGEEQAAATAGGGRPAPTIRLDSQLALHWPQPFAAEVAAKLVMMRETDAAAVRQYMKLRAALLQAQKQRGVKSVMIASAIAGEGKTLTAANLALALGEAGRGRVLLIDADLRQPRIHELFQVSSGTGLNGCLKAAAGPRLPVVELTRSLGLLPGGRPVVDPGELLGSDRMRAVLADASASVDWVILDTPPVALQPDAGLLAPLVDAAVLVIEAGKTPRTMVEFAIDAMGRDRLLGAVLNRARVRRWPSRSGRSLA